MEDQKSNRVARLRTLHIHIGIPKTASTWLQTKVFPQLEHLHFINCPQSTLFVTDNSREKKKRMMGEIFKRSSQIWPGLGNTIFEEMLGERLEWLSDGRDLLISEEMVGREGSRPVLLSAHLREMKRKSQEWGFERLNIVCMIRRQDHWLASHYAQMSEQNPKANQTGFNRLVRKVTSPQESRYRFGMLLDFGVLYDHLAAVSGAENLILLPYEDLKKSPGIFLQSLLRRLDTPVEKIKEICDKASGTSANVRSEQGVWHLRQKRSHIAGLPLPG